MSSTLQSSGKKNEVSFVRDFHYLTALIQHLGAHERWNSRTPRNIADSIGMEMGEIERVLISYPAFFRRSSNLSTQGEPLFMIHLRYARRKKMKKQKPVNRRLLAPQKWASCWTWSLK
ncbi:hypothetical protein LZ656_03500 [Leclercia adecarboxylata]|uniref:hypothetical protein n=1 Tax=Leclercia adecarboxylata TaxID=83655 RepID=UPI001F3B9183|nr:hypothetical protein [Leclercia adecarboxylata]MCE9981450.1 hypothetical protein [Leclercia adecarboxylata]